MRFTIRLLNLNLATSIVFPIYDGDDDKVFNDIVGSVSDDDAIVDEFDLTTLVNGSGVIEQGDLDGQPDVPRNLTVAITNPADTGNAPDTDGILEVVAFSDVIDENGDAIIDSLDGQPDVPRNITIAVTDGDTSITAGTITVNGLDKDDNIISEELDLTEGLSLVGVEMFKEVTSIVLAGITGATTDDDVFIVGYGAVIAQTNITAGLVRVNGLDNLGNVVQEVLDLSQDLTLVGTKVFDEVTSVDFVSLVGVDDGDIIDIGYGEVINEIEITEGLSDPNEPQNLTFNLTGSSTAGLITVFGTDYLDRNITQVFDIAGGEGSNIGDYIFKTVSRILITDLTGSSGDTLIVGIGTRIGFKAGFDLFREECIKEVYALSRKSFTVYTGKSKSAIECSGDSGQPMMVTYNPFYNW